MATFNQTRVGGKLFKQLALAAALCTVGVAHADVVTFEDNFGFVNNREEFTDGKHLLSVYDGTTGDAGVGMFINGADQADICSGPELKCPQNNLTNYLAVQNDSYMFLELASGDNFRFHGFDASFIGTGGALTRGILQVQAFASTGALVGGAVQLSLPAAVAGQYNFASFDLSNFFTKDVGFVRIAGFGCDVTGACFRNQNGSNFAIDNIVTSAKVPEPATLGLLGLGLLGMGALRRRKQAA